MANYNDERTVIKRLMTYNKDDFSQDDVQTYENGNLYYCFGFKYNNKDGYINAEVDPNQHAYAINQNNVVKINMNCSFYKTASPNNYADLTVLMDHILNLFGIRK